MKDYFRQSMAWLHTWVGLLLGWVLYFMFITGTAGYLDTEIDRWMITYSELIFMMFAYMPLIVAVWYGPGEENRQVFFDEAFSPPALVELSAELARPCSPAGRALRQPRQDPPKSVDARHCGR